MTFWRFSRLLADLTHSAVPTTICHLFPKQFVPGRMGASGADALTNAEVTNYVNRGETSACAPSECRSTQDGGALPWA